MTAAWPDTLPHCLLRPTQETLGDGRLKSPTDTGPGKMRARSSAMPRPFSGSFQASSDQVDALVSFVTDTLVRGSLPFTMPPLRGDDDWLVRFVEMPSWSRIAGGKYLVSLSLEVLP
jgi:hypothetical protein